VLDVDQELSVFVIHPHSLLCALAGIRYPALLHSLIGGRRDAVVDCLSDRSGEFSERGGDAQRLWGCRWRVRSGRDEGSA